MELYDLEKGPAWKRDLSRENPSRVEKMEKAIRDREASVLRSLNVGEYW